MKKTALALYPILIILFSIAGTIQLSDSELGDCSPSLAQAAIESSSYSEAAQLLWNKTISARNETAGQNILSRSVKIIQASDGGYVIAGGSNGSSGGDWYDWWLVKTDSNANVEWEKTFGGPYNDYAYSVIQTSDGGFAIAGTMNDKTTVVKTDSAGNVQWSRTYSNGANVSNHASIIQTSDGRYAVAGDDWDRPTYFTYFGPAPNVRLVKTDASGNEEWSKTYVAGTAFSVIQTSDGGYALVGSSWGEGVMFVKTDSIGELEWQRTHGLGDDYYGFSGSDDDYGFSLVQTSDGGFVLFGILWNDPGIIKTDAAGNEVWKYIYYPSQIPTDIIATRDGGYAFCSSEALVKVDFEGNTSWVMGLNNGGSVVQTSDGGYAIAGTFYSKGYSTFEEYPSSYVWIMKIENASSNPTPTAPTPTLEQFPTTLVIVSLVAVVAVVGLGLLVYLKKHDR